jgi:hypothetical protein
MRRLTATSLPASLRLVSPAGHEQMTFQTSNPTDRMSSSALLFVTTPSLMR